MYSSNVFHGIADLTGPLIPGKVELNLRSILEDMTSENTDTTGRLYLFEQISTSKAGNQFKGVFHVNNWERVETVTPYLYAIIKTFSPMLIAPFHLDATETAKYYLRLEACFTESYVTDNESITYDPSRGIFISPNDTNLAAIVNLLGLGQGGNTQATAENRILLNLPPRMTRISPGVGAIQMPQQDQHRHL
jgi:hypothetical protein